MGGLGGDKNMITHNSINTKVEIKLDFDIEDYETVKSILSNRVFVFKMFRIKPYGCIVAKTPHGYHIYIKAHSDMKLTDRDVCVIQILLGDDYKRGVFNWLRVREEKFKEWNVLFTHKERIDIEKSRELLSHLQRLIIASEES